MQARLLYTQWFYAERCKLSHFIRTRLYPKLLVHPKRDDRKSIFHDMSFRARHEEKDRATIVIQKRRSSVSKNHPAGVAPIPAAAPALARAHRKSQRSPAMTTGGAATELKLKRAHGTPLKHKLSVSYARNVASIRESFPVGQSAIMNELSPSKKRSESMIKSDSSVKADSPRKAGLTKDPENGSSFSFFGSKSKIIPNETIEPMTPSQMLKMPQQSSNMHEMHQNIQSFEAEVNSIFIGNKPSYFFK